MRACQCGGMTSEHQLTGERTAWTCRGCGRYEAMLPPALNHEPLKQAKHWPFPPIPREERRSAA